MTLIFAYTRKQAIEDGVLIDVTETAKEAGLRFPTAITAAAWSKSGRPQGRKLPR